MATDIRLVQLARILGLPGETLTADAARAAIAARPADVASAFFHEAADNDDVISVAAALDYLEGRLAFFGDLIPASGAAPIRESFRTAVESWE